MSTNTKQHAQYVNEDLAPIERKLNEIKHDVDQVKDKDLSAKFDGIVKSVKSTREYLSQRLSKSSG